MQILQLPAITSSCHSRLCRTQLRAQLNSTDSEYYITTDGQSTSLSWNKAPVWGLRPHFYYCQTVAGLLMWGALPDERKGLLFTIAPGPRQRSHFWVLLPWDSWPYFTVSDLTELDCPSCLLYNFSVRTTSKTPFFYCCFRFLFRGNVFTEPLLRNGLLFIRLLHSNGCTRCLFVWLCQLLGNSIKW
jgi:hypothetical protein